MNPKSKLIHHFNRIGLSTLLNQKPEYFDAQNTFNDYISIHNESESTQNLTRNMQSKFEIVRTKKYNSVTS